MSEIEDKGDVVVWPTTDATGRPPAEILRQFPNLVAEVVFRGAGHNDNVMFGPGVADAVVGLAESLR